MNGATGREREERAQDALLVSALRQEDNDGDINAKSLPELTEEKAAVKALGATLSSGCWLASGRSGTRGNRKKTARRMRGACPGGQRGRHQSDSNNRNPQGRRRGDGSLFLWLTCPSTNWSPKRFPSPFLVLFLVCPSGTFRLRQSLLRRSTPVSSCLAQGLGSSAAGLV